MENNALSNMVSRLHMVVTLRTGHWPCRLSLPFVWSFCPSVCPSVCLVSWRRRMQGTVPTYVHMYIRSIHVPVPCTARAYIEECGVSTSSACPRFRFVLSVRSPLPLPVEVHVVCMGWSAPRNGSAATDRRQMDIEAPVADAAMHSSSVGTAIRRRGVRNQ